MPRAFIGHSAAIACANGGIIGVEQERRQCGDRVGVTVGRALGFFVAGRGWDRVLSFRYPRDARRVSDMIDEAKSLLVDNSQRWRPR
jgi:hypothetical protein